MSGELIRRTVAIVGRPNVGKSALFNRLVRRRLAIVHEECGVTRDRITAEASWGGQPFEVIDTGGLALMDQARAHEAIAEATRDQARIAIEAAAVVVFVVDVTEGLQPLDRDVEQLLRQSGRPVLVAANKADLPRHDAQADEFYAFGFPVFPLSAEHGRGVENLVEAILARLPPAPPPDPGERLKIAVVGRPNAGKSSYINRLLGESRMIVSETPGTTRDSVEIPFEIGRGETRRRYVLVDTAGLRKVHRIHNSVERFSVFRAEKSIERADVVVMMMDAREGPTERDKKIAAMVVEKNKGYLLLVNKWDLAKGLTTLREYETALRRAMPFLSHVPVLFLSALTGEKVLDSLDAIDRVASQVQTRFSTGVLNRVLREAVERRQPPSVRGRRLKLYYVTQVGDRPLRIKLFVNDPSCMVPAYESYLVRSLRERFGLEGAPLLFVLASSHADRVPSQGRKPVTGHRRTSGRKRARGRK